MQEKDHLNPSESPSLYTPDDDVALDFELREIPYDEEMTYVEPKPDEDHYLLHF